MVRCASNCVLCGTLNACHILCCIAFSGPKPTRSNVLCAVIFRQPFLQGKQFSVHDLFSHHVIRPTNREISGQRSPDVHLRSSLPPPPFVLADPKSSEPKQWADQGELLTMHPHHRQPPPRQKQPQQLLSLLSPPGRHPQAAELRALQLLRVKGEEEASLPPVPEERGRVPRQSPPRLTPMRKEALQAAMELEPRGPRQLLQVPRLPPNREAKRAVCPPLSRLKKWSK